MQLGQNIKNLRKVCGYTQQELAERLCVSFQTVSKWERGLSCPDVLLLPRLADLLGVSMDILFEYVPNTNVRTTSYRDYRDEAYFWGTDPTPFCYQVLEKYPPSRHLRLLEIGCGEGRDAVFFARNGYDVEAFDLVPDGIRKANKMAALHSVSITAFCADMLNYKPEGMYDVVFASRALHYLPPDRYANFFETYKQHTVLGGIHAFLVLVDKPTIKTAPDTDGATYLMKSGEIFTYYYDWNFLVFEEKIIDCCSSGVAHQHCVNLMLAVKP